MERVENVVLPRIEILCNSLSFKHLAEAVGYGIEEEGLPYQISIGEYIRMDGYDLSQQGGLGAAVVIDKETVSVFSWQLKEVRPIFEYKMTTSDNASTIENARLIENAKAIENAKIVGKNTARIIKNKPFIELLES